jgi:hypothetical protein
MSFVKFLHRASNGLPAFFLLSAYKNETVNPDLKPGSCFSSGKISHFVRDDRQLFCLSFRAPARNSSPNVTAPLPQPVLFSANLGRCRRAADSAH